MAPSYAAGCLLHTPPPGRGPFAAQIEIAIGKTNGDSRAETQARERQPSRDTAGAYNHESVLSCSVAGEMAWAAPTQFCPLLARCTGRTAGWQGHAGALTRAR